MSHNPDNLKYTRSHEWVKKNQDGSVTVGITEHAQELLGEVVYVELPELEKQVHQNQEVCVVESVKAAADVYAPVSGKVIRVNENLSQAPETINESCYSDGWLFQLEMQDESELAGLLDAQEYQNIVDSEHH